MTTAECLLLRPDFKSSAEGFLCTEWRGVEIFQQNRKAYVNASYEWLILEQFMGECCPIFSCSYRPWKLMHFFKGWRDVKQNNTKTTTHPMQTSWFQANFTCEPVGMIMDFLAYRPYAHPWMKWCLPLPWTPLSFCFPVASVFPFAASSL